MVLSNNKFQVHRLKAILSLSGLICIVISGEARHLLQEHGVGVGCSGSGGLCCQGQNASCVALGPSQNNKDGEMCFCDEVCYQLGDCCLDYRMQCPVVDCVLSVRWTEWSECDVRCGLGVQNRTRSVLVRPLNGGKECGDVIERKKCEGTNCKVARASEATDELKETGEIVPASFATWRTNALYSPFEDKLRQNLFLEQAKYAELRRDNDKPSYCAKYTITEARQSCQRPSNINTSQVRDDAWVRQLVRGTTICVECQSVSMHKTLGSRCTGHGVNQRQTQWKAVTIPRCHGSWIMTSPHIEKCKCNPNDDASFIFV